MLEQINIAQVGNYIANGDRQGQVTVREITSGKVIRTFKMDEGVVVREVFFLDSGRTVGASQKICLKGLRENYRKVKPSKKKV